MISYYIWYTRRCFEFSVVMGIMGDSLVFTCIYLSAPLYMYMHSPAYLSATHFTFVTVDTPHLSLIVMVNGYPNKTVLTNFDSMNPHKLAYYSKNVSKSTKLHDVKVISKP